MYQEGGNRTKVTTSQDSTGTAPVEFFFDILLKRSNMRQNRFIYLLVALGLITPHLAAQQESDNVIQVKSSRHARPLVEKWASEYEKRGVPVKIEVVTDSSPAGNSDMHVSGAALKQHDTEQQVSSIGRYALLPVTSEENSGLNQLRKKRINEKRLEELFFESSEPNGEPSKPDQLFHSLTIYSGNNADSFAGTFASHFDFTTTDLRGKKIAGDDLYLLEAIRRDNSGITFNSLSYLFDVETRLLKDGLALLPLDLKKEQRELFNRPDVDDFIDLLEKERISLIPLGEISVGVDPQNAAVKSFLRWILTEGQEYNREYGFLRADEKVLATQLRELADDQLTASNQ